MSTTPSSSVSRPATVGLATIFHAVPVQCSVRVRSTLPGAVAPTAQASVGPLASTDVNQLSVEFWGLGLATIFHAVPQTTRRECSTFSAAAEFVAAATARNPHA